AGANACPPEDCGGIGGYYNLLKILRDPQHPDHADMKDWIGGDLNAEEFSVEGVNRIFKRLKP
ncbi:MAG TPA: plasmid pRiA4b ORF-3 family protein, partial [Verrucomicrobiota bacterium]|nr:plasmid pRiA4b ORF-3 family protein [Verrucomicrobiota bacterium]